MIKHYRSADGVYLGTFSEDRVPVGALEVPFPPFSADYRWTNEGGWEEVFSISSLRSVVNGLRDAERSSLWWRGKRIDSNPAALMNIVGRSVAYSVTGRLEPSYWITADNETIELTEADFFDLARSVDQHIDGAYVRAGQCKAKIMDGTLTTADAVREYWNEVLGGPLS